MNKDITIDLEAMIDRHGLTHVLTGLSLICGEKAEHIRCNWQDAALAKHWDKAMMLIDLAANKVAQLPI